MKYSLAEIAEIEAHYNILLPKTYKIMLFLIGEKITNFNKNTSTKTSVSIYKIQEKIKNSIENFESSEESIAYKLNNVFFLTNSLVCVEDIKHYFIELTYEKDCPVYCWTYHGYSDTNSIEKNYDTIEEWLYKINPVLFFELQARKMFCDPHNLF